MSTRLLPRLPSYILAAIALALGLLTLAGHSWITAQAARPAPPGRFTLDHNSPTVGSGATYVVNSTADQPDNGGATSTRALLSGSPAIDAGDSNGCTNGQNQTLTTDQRHFRRPIGPRCDIGAVEYSPYTLDLPLILRQALFGAYVGA